MPEIEIRPANAEDIKQLVKMDHSYLSNHVWQMDPHFTSGETGAVFREVNLPRKAKVDYPRSPQLLAKHWENYSGVLVAVHAGEPAYDRASSGESHPYRGDVSARRRMRLQ